MVHSRYFSSFSATQSESSCGYHADRDSSAIFFFFTSLSLSFRGSTQTQRMNNNSKIWSKSEPSTQIILMCVFFFKFICSLFNANYSLRICLQRAFFSKTGSQRELFLCTIINLDSFELRKCPFKEIALAHSMQEVMYTLFNQFCFF